ncbi:MAG: hypothetical protein QM727_09955 [Niabella sp.]
MPAQKGGAKKGSRKLLPTISGGNDYQHTARHISYEYLLTHAAVPCSVFFTDLIVLILLTGTNSCEDWKNSNNPRVHNQHARLRVRPGKKKKWFNQYHHRYGQGSFSFFLKSK